MTSAPFGPVEYTSSSTLPVTFTEPRPTWLQVVGGGTVVVSNRDGSTGTYVCTGGEVLGGDFQKLTSFTCDRVRMGSGPMPSSAINSVANGNATASVAGLQTAANFSKQANSNGIQVRGVVTTNVANLAAFVVLQDGITYAAGDIVLLAKQTTAAQNGPYVVGTVSGTAPLTRPTWWAAASTIPVGAVFEAGSEGTLWGGSSWKATCAKGGAVDTDDPTLYPRVIKGTATLASGVKALGATQGLYLLSGASIQCTQNTTGGTVTTTVRYVCKAASRTTGIIGTAAATISAVTSDGTTVNTNDTSTVDYLVQNW